jgi:hypothetical protein
MNLHCLRPRSCASTAPPTQVAVQPSCKRSPPEHRHRSAAGAGEAEGKIEGDGTAMRRGPCLHVGGRGTRAVPAGAASKWRAAPILDLPRAVFAVVCRAAMELRHDQA